MKTGLNKKVLLAGSALFLSTALSMMRVTQMDNQGLNNDFKVRPYDSLPALDIGWLTIKDHFISTVGPNSGRGESLNNLLVIADARMQPQSSFPKHPHEDMEILTWVAEGTLHHQDNNGTDQTVPQHHLQLMSARDGIYHAEGNQSNTPLRILQIWIKPDKAGGSPEVKTARLDSNELMLMAGPKDAPLIIRQDLTLHGAMVTEKQMFEVPPGKLGYGIFIGKLTLNEEQLRDGDGVILEAGRYEVRGTGQLILITQNN